MRANLRLLRRLYGDSRSLLAIGALAAVGQSALLVPVALLVRRVFDRSIPQHRPGEIAVTGLAVFGLTAASAGLGWLSRRLIVRISKESVGRLRIELMAHLYSLPQAWHDAQTAGELHAAVVSDSERLDQLATQLGRTVAPALIIAAALAVVALVMDPLLFAVLAAAVPGLLLASRRLARTSRRLALAWVAAVGAFSAQAQLALRAMRLTKVQGGESWELERRTRQIEEVVGISRRLDSAQASHGLAQTALAAAVGSGLLVIGGIAVARHEGSLGGLLAFYAVAVLLLRQVAAIGSGVSGLAVVSESLARLERVLSADAAEPYRGRRRLGFRGEVAFREVSFAYGERPCLSQVSFAVAAGEHVAVIGPNGSGKSTLVSLLLGLYRPQSGEVSFDGVPLAELDVRHLRRQLGVVLQDPILFPGTIAENIAYGRPDADRRAIAAAAGTALAAEFIEALPGGYETPIGDEGVLLSGGERQRVALARALVGRSPLVVLDEPTTYLDGATIDRLVENLSTLDHAPSVLLVTHDLAVAGRADRVIHLRDGRLAAIEAGSRPGRGPDAPRFGPGPGSQRFGGARSR
jgi:ABC-type multidrug transport system fused ATPase/permease subunit